MHLMNRRLLQGKPRRDLLRSVAPRVWDLRQAMEQGVPIDGLVARELAELAPGAVLELIVLFQDPRLDRQLASLRLGSWVEESPDAIHYLVYRPSESEGS